MYVCMYVGQDLQFMYVQIYVCMYVCIVLYFIERVILNQVGASLDVFKRDAKLMRGDGPVVFAQAKHGAGVEEITDHILQAWKKSRDQR